MPTVQVLQLLLLGFKICLLFFIIQYVVFLQYPLSRSQKGSLVSMLSVTVALTNPQRPAYFLRYDDTPEVVYASDYSCPTHGVILLWYKFIQGQYLCFAGDYTGITPHINWYQPHPANKQNHSRFYVRDIDVQNKIWQNII